MNELVNSGFGSVVTLHRKRSQTAYGVNLRQPTQIAAVRVQGAAERQVVVSHPCRLGIRVFVDVPNEAPGLSLILL